MSFNKINCCKMGKEGNRLYRFKITKVYCRQKMKSHILCACLGWWMSLLQPSTRILHVSCLPVHFSDPFSIMLNSICNKHSGSKASSFNTANTKTHNWT
jgi:hypothetical protein